MTRKEENPSGASGTQNDGSLLEQLANRIKEVKDLLGTNEKNRFAVIEELIEEARSESAQLKINAVEALGVANHLREENQELQEELVQLKLRDMVDQTQTLNSIAYEYNEDIINAHRKERDELLAALEEQQQQVQYMKEENALLQDKINDIEGMEMRSEGEVTNSRDSTLVGVEDHDKTKGSVNTLHSTTSVRSSPSTYPNVNNLGNPLAIAEALKNGASSDTIVAAAGMLQSYVVIQELLEKEKMSRKQLAEEVMELNEIVNSKTFKPPSAWAERELKYKQEKRQWQEERKAADAEICRLRRQLEEIRNMSGTAALEHRIEILESRLLESEQNLALARATIHEMELASRASEGEFSLSGVRPYRGPRGVEGDVSQAVEKIESSNGTPVRQSPSVSSSSNMLSPTVAGVTTDAQSLKRIADYSRLIELEKENELLKAQLHQFSGGHDVFKTPERVPQKVRRLENELMQLNANKVYLIEELKTLKASIPSHNVHYSQHPEEQGVTVSKSEGDTCNPAEPCNDSSELDENDPRLLDIKRRIQVHLFLPIVSKDGVATSFPSTLVSLTFFFLFLRRSNIY